MPDVPLVLTPAERETVYRDPGQLDAILARKRADAAPPAPPPETPVARPIMVPGNLGGAVIARWLENPPPRPLGFRGLGRK